jgi:hypothetical protein
MSEAKANSSDKALRNLEDLLPDLLQAGVEALVIAARAWLRASRPHGPSKLIRPLLRQGKPRHGQASDRA